MPCSELYEQFVKVATEEQLARFEQFKRSKFPRATMKKLMGDLVGNSTERCAIALARTHDPHPSACEAHISYRDILCRRPSPRPWWESWSSPRSRR